MHGNAKRVSRFLLLLCSHSKFLAYPECCGHSSVPVVRVHMHDECAGAGLLFGWLHLERLPDVCGVGLWPRVVTAVHELYSTDTCAHSLAEHTDVTMLMDNEAFYTYCCEVWTSGARCTSWNR